MIERSGQKTGARGMQPANQGKADHHDGGRACECCGNEYDKPIEIVVNGISHYFDCFECAIHKLAPTCSHCGVRIIGHGIEAGGTFFCCATCARHQGVKSVVDRA